MLPGAELIWKMSNVKSSDPWGGLLAVVVVRLQFGDLHAFGCVNPVKGVRVRVGGVNNLRPRLTLCLTKD